MSTINNIGNTTPLQQITSQPIQKQVPATPPTQLAVTDTVELSGTASTPQADSIRNDRIAAIKTAIQNGTYEDDQKLTVAADRLLNALGE